METAIQNCLDEIDTLITNSNGLQNIDSELKEYDRLKRDLQAISDTRGKGAIFRSKVRWTEEGERPTKYFFNMEKRNFNTKVIAELKPDPDGNVIVDEKEIMREIHSYYADLYKSEVDSGNIYIYILGQDLLDSLNASYDVGELSISQRRGSRRGVITLVAKKILTYCFCQIGALSLY